MYTFRAPKIDVDRLAESDMVLCGEDNRYQVQIQDSTDTNIRLLQDTVDKECAPQPELADLARQVNDFFEAKAKSLLTAKRQASPKSGQRVEITVLLTDRGMQLAYAHGLEQKEVAPTPSKSLTRQLLGPLSLGRKTWVMPAHHTAKNSVVPVHWPAGFWITVLLAAAAAVTWLLFFHDGSGGITGFHMPGSKS